MKINKNNVLALGTVLLLILPLTLTLVPTAKASDAMVASDKLPVQIKPNYRGFWYKFETPLITLLFPAAGKKPMFIWWYTNDSSHVYVVKFKGLIEYLTFDEPYYIKRFQADELIIREKIMKDFVEPKVPHPHGREMIINKFMWFLPILGMHPPYLPFSGCKWKLAPPTLVETENSTYWAFNFTLERTPMPMFDFAEGNIQIRCRFYNTTTTEVPDEDYPQYNYTVAAGQLKFDFVVSNWEWNIDKLEPFLEWLKEEYGIEIPEHRTGLALWINMASIDVLEPAENEVQYNAENKVEAGSQLKGVTINDQYYDVEKNETSQDEKPIEATLRLRERFRERIKLQFATEAKSIPVGFLEFVPWARLLDENGTTVEYVNVTASYIAAGRHLRLFICYPYFGNYTLEHDPTIGLTSAPQVPTLISLELIGILLITTITITIALLVYKRKKRVINIVSP